MFYLYIKSFHLIFLIAWMVSLLYLPRLFVYHSTVLKKSSSYNLFLLMEIRLIKIIAIPATILTFISGITLIYQEKELIYENYFIIKLFFGIVIIDIPGLLNSHLQNVQSKKQQENREIL